MKLYIRSKFYSSKASMFKHFLITRFNLRKEDWTTNKHNKPILTDEWHRNRFKLFTDYCFPSVMSQTNTNFEWIVFFDSSTKKEYRLIISKLDEQFLNFKPIFIDGMTQFLPSIKTYISNFKEKYIITTGIDNDDCIGKHFIEEIQKRFNNQYFMCLDFIDGYTIQTQSEIKVGKKLHQYNPFLSLFEINNNPKTIKDRSHRNWKKEKNVLQIHGVRIWSSVIHHENKVNEFTGYGHTNLDDFFNEFVISKPQQDFIQKQAIPVNKWRLESAINYVSSYWKFYSKNIKRNLGFYNKK
ncbi:glycosyltransferase [Cognatitamlana onchidii]|uniref:glycosyltransferase n=1 Tax=Cognatitamlana onchidii TaxID=2562860 RepID=UPI0010A64DA2|nr:glycosyltransferase [Algibacter onchidii]